MNIILYYSLTKMDSLHNQLTKAIETRIELEQKIKEIAKEKDKLIREIESCKLQEKKIIVQLSKPSVQSQFGVSLQQRRISKKRKIVQKTVICGINGCNFTCNPGSMTMHRKNCTGQLGPCRFCGVFYCTPGEQVKHMKKCEKKHSEKEIVVDTVEATNGTEALEFKSSEQQI